MSSIIIDTTEGYDFTNLLSVKKIEFKGTLKQKHFDLIRELDIPDVNLSNAELELFGNDCNASISGYKDQCENSFYNCRKLTHITMPKKAGRIIKNCLFCLCSSLLKVELPSELKYIGDWAFFCCSSITTIELPSGISKIGNHIFSNCVALENVGLPESISQIGSWAFSGCLSIKKIKLPNQLKKIENNTFVGCRSLTSIDIPSKLEDIGDYAFAGCDSLVEIQIPNVNKIGEGAFYGCTSAIITISTTLKDSNIGQNAFAGCRKSNNLREKYSCHKKLEYRQKEQPVLTCAYCKMNYCNNQADFHKTIICKHCKTKYCVQQASNHNTINCNACTIKYCNSQKKDHNILICECCENKYCVSQADKHTISVSENCSFSVNHYKEPSITEVKDTENLNNNYEDGCQSSNSKSDCQIDFQAIIEHIKHESISIHCCNASRNCGFFSVEQSELLEHECECEFMEKTIN